MGERAYSLELVPGVLSLISNRRSIPQYPLICNSSLQVVNGYKDESNNISLNYAVADLERRPASPGGKYFGLSDNGATVYENQIGAFGWIRMEVLWRKRSPILKVNRLYGRVGRVSVETVFSPGRHLRDLSNIALLDNGYCLMHAAGIWHQGRAALFIGLSNTGKTTLVTDLVRNHGAMFYGDDLVVTDGANLYACPETGTNVNMRDSPSFFYSGYQFIKRSIPFAENMMPSPSLSFSRFMGQQRQAKSDAVSDIYILQRSSKNKVSALAPEEAARLMYASNQVEFTHNTNQALWAGEYLGGGIPMSDCQEKEKEICDRLTKCAAVHHVCGDSDFFKRHVVSSFMGG
jgi:hypothetical protein